MFGHRVLFNIDSPSVLNRVGRPENVTYGDMLLLIAMWQSSIFCLPHCQVSYISLETEASIIPSATRAITLASSLFCLFISICFISLCDNGTVSIARAKKS